MGEQKKDGPANDAGAAERAQLLVLDLDGTVLSPTGHVTPRTRKAIRNVIDAGIKVCIATGRSWWESKHVIQEAELVGPGVFVGGAIVNDMPSGKSLGHTKMHRDVAREICHIMDESGLAAMVMQDADHADIEWLISAELEMPPTVPEWLARHGSTFQRVSGLRSAAHEWTIRISTVASFDDSAKLAERLLRALGDRVYLHEITIPTTGARVIEVFDSSVNKWTGVEQVINLLGITEKNVIAVGDDMNDLHMLQHSSVGVAMGNANEHVKKIADGVIGSHVDDGLAKFLESFVAGGATLTSARRAVRKA